MPSLFDARTAITNFLIGMGQSPTNVIITSFEAKGIEWLIEGEFKQGMLGDTIIFTATMRTTDMSLNRFKITGKKEKTGEYI